MMPSLSLNLKGELKCCFEGTALPVQHEGRGCGWCSEQEGWFPGELAVSSLQSNMCCFCLCAKRNPLVIPYNELKATYWKNSNTNIFNKNHLKWQKPSLRKVDLTCTFYFLVWSMKEVGFKMLKALRSYPLMSPLKVKEPSSSIYIYVYVYVHVYVCMYAGSLNHALLTLSNVYKSNLQRPWFSNLTCRSHSRTDQRRRKRKWKIVETTVLNKFKCTRDIQHPVLY